MVWFSVKKSALLAELSVHYYSTLAIGQSIEAPELHHCADTASYYVFQACIYIITQLCT